MQLKGTTKIELTDIHTGEVETYENHNMVTNALKDIFTPLGLSQRPYRYFYEFTPYYKILLGVILCFDTEIPEEEDNYFPPATANLVGCAAYNAQNNTTNTFRGGFNQTESEINLKERYAKYVYDFATSQANGTISSVCLTHVNGGYTSYGGKNAVYTTNFPLPQSLCEDTLQYVYPDRTGATTSSKYSGMTIGKTEMIFLIDRKNDCVLYFKIVDSTHIHIIKRRAFLKSVSILDNVYSTKPMIEEIELEELSTALSGGYWGYNYDPTDDCLYICNTSRSDTQVNGTINVTKIKVGSWKVTQYTVKNTTETIINTNSWWQMYVACGYLLVKSYNSPYRLFKIELSNPANVVEFTRTDFTNVNAYAKLTLNGRVYFDTGDSQCLVCNLNTNELLMPECQSFFNNRYNQYNMTPVRNEPLLYFVDGGTYTTAGWYMMTNYLATINNLDTPVTKTADKTMKITYILQEQ